MHQKIAEELEADRRARLRHLAMQLVVQLYPLCESKREVAEVLALMDSLAEWQYAATPHLAAVFKVVS